MTPVRQNNSKIYGAQQKTLLNGNGEYLFPPNLSDDEVTLAESEENSQRRDLFTQQGLAPKRIVRSFNNTAMRNATLDYGPDIRPSVSEGNGEHFNVSWFNSNQARVDWPDDDADDYPAARAHRSMSESVISDSDNSQDASLPSYFKQRAVDMASRRKQARELRREGSVFVDEEEVIRIPGTPFGFKMGKLKDLAADLDCSCFAAHRSGEDYSEGGFRRKDFTFDDDDEDESLLSEDGSTYPTMGPSRTLYDDKCEQALKWADENFLCGKF